MISRLFLFFLIPVLCLAGCEITGTPSDCDSIAVTYEKINPHVFVKRNCFNHLVSMKFHRSWSTHQQAVQPEIYYSAPFPGAMYTGLLQIGEHSDDVYSYGLVINGLKYGVWRRYDRNSGRFSQVYYSSGIDTMKVDGFQVESLYGEVRIEGEVIFRESPFYREEFYEVENGIVRILKEVKDGDTVVDFQYWKERLMAETEADLRVVTVGVRLQYLYTDTLEVEYFNGKMIRYAKNSDRASVRMEMQKNDPRQFYVFDINTGNEIWNGTYLEGKETEWKGRDLIIREKRKIRQKIRLEFPADEMPAVPERIRLQMNRDYYQEFLYEYLKILNNPFRYRK